MKSFEQNHCFIAERDILRRKKKNICRAIDIEAGHWQLKIPIVDLESIQRVKVMKQGSTLRVHIVLSCLRGVLEHIDEPLWCLVYKKWYFVKPSVNSNIQQLPSYFSVIKTLIVNYWWHLKYSELHSLGSAWIAVSSQFGPPA